MVRIMKSQYLRNKNFSSTIVLEFTQTETRDKQCVGVVFDVDTAKMISAVCSSGKRRDSWKMITGQKAGV